MQLKLSAPLAVLLVGHTAVVSAEKRNDAAVIADCFELDTEYEGNNIYAVPFREIASPQQCFHLCAKEKYCHAWTWTPEKDCFLKDARAFLNRVSLQTLNELAALQKMTKSEKYLKSKSLVGKISGPKECFPVSLFKCYDVGANFEGYNLLAFTNETFESPLECHYRCQQSKNCFYWTWDSAQKSCTLKVNDAPMGWRKDETTKHLISGAGICGKCYEPSTAYVGHDISRIENISVKSAEQCKILCSRNRNCFFWTWIPQTERCHLKDHSAYEDRLVDESTHGMVSGARNCENHGKSLFVNIHSRVDKLQEAEQYLDLNNTQMSNRNMYISLLRPQKCYKIDAEYAGHDIVDYEDVATSQDCQRLCKQNDECFYWTWDGPKLTCFLKGYNAYKDMKKNDETIGKVSATKFCPCPGFR